jgi:hypothetical protein
MRCTAATPDPSRWRRRLRALAVAILLAGGCKNSQRYDLIEAELRSKDRELETLKGEVEQLRLLGQAYQGHLARTADPTSLPGSVPTLPLKEITLGTGTGGADSDGVPGDELLQVVLVPTDADGSAVKVPGRVVILASEILPNGVKVPIGRWDVEPERLRRAWKPSLLTTGYFLSLTWDKPPGTLDGRVYESDRDVPVKPIGRVSPVPGLPSPFAEELPPPRPAVQLGIPSPQ